MRSLFSSLLLLAACHGSDPSGGPPWYDLDGDGSPAWLDCDDHDVTIYPGALDTWYDGVDTDCAGDDDFDRDGDGHRSALYGGDDCMDGDPSVSPSSEEILYDNLDNDCDPSTPDSDADADGFLPPEDCDDANPDIHPGAPEALGDATDGDCDGDPNGATLRFDERDWEGISGPSLVAMEGRVVMALAYEERYDPVLGQEAFGGGVFLDFAADSLGPVPLEEERVFHEGAAGERFSQLDLSAAGGQLWLGYAYLGTSGLVTLGALPYTYLSGVGLWSLGSPSYVYLNGDILDHVDLRLDRDDLPWVAGGNQAHAVFLVGDAFKGSWGEVETDASSGVFLDVASSPPLPLTACSAAGDCTTWLPDPTTGELPAHEEQPWSSSALTRVHEAHGWMAGVKAGQGVVLWSDAGERWDLFEDIDAVDVEVASEGDELFVVVSTSDGRLLIAWGQPGQGAMPRATLSLPEADHVPERVSVALTPHRVVVAAACPSVAALGERMDRVGWVFIER